MGTGAELLLLPLGLMCLLSIGAFFSAFFSRTVGRTCAGLSIGMSALFFLLFLQLSGWDFGWLVASMMRHPLFLVVFGSMLLSFVAVAAPLRRPDGNDPREPQTRGGPRWGLFVFACLIAIVVAAFIGFSLIENSRGEQKTIALLAGDADIRLKRIQIDYQQRRLICTDPEVLRYLEERLRKPDLERRELGTTYQLSLIYEKGGAASFATCWSESGDFSLFIGDAGEGGKCHGILLTHPRPRSVDEMIEFLRKDYREAAGTILILEPSGSRVQRDESLVAR